MINELVYKAHNNAVAKGFWDDYANTLGMILWDCEACKYNSYVFGTKDGCKEGNPEKCHAAVHYKNVFTSSALMLVVSELGEAVEGLRKGDKENLAEELADTCIRIFDLCGGLQIDLETAIYDKMQKNLARPSKHGKKF